MLDGLPPLVRRAFLRAQLDSMKQATLRARSSPAAVPVQEGMAAWTDGIRVARGMPLAEMLQPYSAATLVRACGGGRQEVVPGRAGAG